MYAHYCFSRVARGEFDFPQSSRHDWNWQFIDDSSLKELRHLIAYYSATLRLRYYANISRVFLCTHLVCGWFIDLKLRTRYFPKISPNLSSLCITKEYLLSTINLFLFPGVISALLSNNVITLISCWFIYDGAPVAFKRWVNCPAEVHAA